MLSRADRDAALETVFLSSLPADLAGALLEDAETVEFDRGETVFLEGEPARSMVLVLDGWIKLHRIKANGAEAVVGVFTRGGSVAEAPAIQDEAYPVSCSAVTDCRLLLLRASRIRQLMTDRPEMMRAMLGNILRHLHGLVAQIEQLKAQSGSQRVAEFLASLAPVETGACTVVLPYDKSLIAARLGMKPESLSRAFARLRPIGVSIIQNRAAIADVSALRDFSEEDRAAGWGRAQ